jgi:hypothetical protein
MKNPPELSTAQNSPERKADLQPPRKPTTAVAVNPKPVKTNNAGASAPQLGIETKFMQSFRVATAVSGGSEVVSVRNGNGEVELFTTGTDGTIWNFYPDPTSDTGYNGVSTGLTAATIAVGVDSSGKIVVFAATGLTLTYIVENDDPINRWSPPQTITVPQPSNPVAIAKLFAAEISGALYVAVLTKYNSSQGTMYAVAYSNWQTSAPQFQSSGMIAISPNCVFQPTYEAFFTCVDGTCPCVDLQTRVVSSLPLQTNQPSIESTSVDYANGYFFFIYEGTIYTLLRGQAGWLYTSPISTGVNFRQVNAVTDGSGLIHVFGLGVDNTLYHFPPNTQFPGLAGNPSPIFPNAALAEATANDHGGIELFIVGTSAATLTHLTLEETSGNWQPQALEVPTGNQVETYISYSTDVTIYDVMGVPAVNYPVSIQASEETRITVNGATFFVGPDRAAQISTNSTGLLSITQETDALAIPLIQIGITGLSVLEQTVTIEQSAGVQQTLLTVTSDQLTAATDASGNFLIPEPYRSDAQTMGSMATALNQCMGLVEQPDSAVPPAFYRKNAKPGVWLGPIGTRPSPRRINPKNAKCWQISFDGKSAVYEEITPEKAASIVAAKTAALPSAGLLNWIGSLGDVLDGIIEGAISSVNGMSVVMQAVSDAVQATFNFFVAGVEYVYTAVVDFVEEAFDIVEAFFSQVGVVFEEAFEWLGYIFNWDDILLTHEAIAYTLNQYLGFLGGAAKGIQAVFDNGIMNLQSQIDSYFENLITSIAGDSTLGGYEQKNQQSSPDLLSSVSNNPFYNGFIDNAGAATMSSASFSALDTDPISQLLGQLETFATNTATGDAWNSAISYFKNLGSSPDQIFTQSLKGLLEVVKGIIEAMLGGVQAVVDAIFEIIQTLISAMTALLNAEWNIPFVSDLYSMITNGATLTTIDLFALIAAIPTTALYKIVQGNAPFADEASVTTFKSLFSSQTMLQASGLGGGAVTKVADGQGGMLPEEWADLVSIAGSASSLFYGGFTAFLDIQPPGVATPVVNTVSVLALVSEALAQGCSFPWFSESLTASCTTTGGINAMHWFYQGLGVLLDLGYVAELKHFPDSDGDLGVAIAVLYGVGDGVMALLASWGQSPTSLPVAANVLPLLPEVGKILRLGEIVTWSEGSSLLFLAAADALFMTAATMADFVENTPESAQVSSQPRGRRSMLSKTTPSRGDTESLGLGKPSVSVPTEPSPSGL